VAARGKIRQFPTAYKLKAIKRAEGGEGVLPVAPAVAIVGPFCRFLTQVPACREETRLKGYPMTLKRVLAFTMLENIGLGVQAHAQAPCPEVVRLRNTATEAWKQAMRVPTAERCKALDHASSATRTTLDYATHNRESCGISAQLLNQIEKYDREAEQAHDNACAGRPLRPYPPDIIQR
jgi:hypothetical protein